MSEPVYSNFDPISSKQWKQQIQFDLKGADYNETLIWESLENVKVKPFYHGDEDNSVLQTRKKSDGFLVCQDIFVYDLEKSIFRANDSLNRGAESLYFIIEDKNLDISRLIKEVAIENTTVYFELRFLCADFTKALDLAVANRNATVFVLLDPIHNLAKDGNWFESSPIDNLDFLKLQTETLKSASALSVDASLYQNAGANIVQQLAYTLAHANEYLNTVESTDKPMLLQMAIGSNYFFEIAKFRAMRVLYETLVKEYNSNIECHILAKPSKRNKTIYDYNVNLLRTTTECMSAILGGADSVSNMPYDVLYHKSNEFGERISRNQLLIMKEESYLDKVGNPADGSYYIESLTKQLAEKALALFKDIEANGGFLKQLKEGTIQRKIMENAEKEQALFDSGKEVLIGTNKHPNKNDRMSGDMELFPFQKFKSKKTLLQPIVEKRLSEKSEQERLDSEKE